MDRKGRRPLLVVGTIACLFAGVGLARADATGAYAGQMTGKQTVAAAAALTQSGRTVSGTLVLGMPDTSFDGSYAVTGVGSGRKLRLAGANTSGARLVWRATINASGATGRLRVRGPQGRLAGRLTLTRRTVTGDGSTCDAVLTQNQAFFTTQVMDQVLLPICAACHAPGGQAQAARLHVLRGDPLATARSVALLIDTANPGASLLVEKPLAAVPHGGGRQIAPASAEEQTLRQWADVVAQAQCVAQGASSAATSVFARDCAGCHGSDGAGSATGPDIRCAVRTLLADAVRNGRGAMPPVPLSAAELTTVAAYLDGQCSHQPPDVYAANCASCHGPTAGGGPNGPNIRCGAEEFAQAVRQGTEGMPAFPSLGGAEITGLARYVAGFCGLGGGGGDD